MIGFTVCSPCRRIGSTVQFSGARAFGRRLAPPDQTMPGHVRTGRADHVASAVSAGVPTARSLISLLARSPEPNELLSALHEHALEVTGGVCSILFQHNPRNGLLHATSGSGLDSLRVEAWTPDSAEASLIDSKFDGQSAVLVADADRLAPDL